MASQKRSRFGFLPEGLKKKEKAGDMPDKVLNQSPGASSALGPSTTQAQASTSKQSATEKTKGVLGGLFSRTNKPSTRPTTPTPQPISAIHTIEQQDMKDHLTDAPDTGKLTSKQAEVVPETTNNKKVLVLDLGIGAIDLLCEVSDIAGLVLPNPVGAVLEKVTVVLGTLKVCPQKLTSVRTG
jgi:hypothetical protein